MVTSRTLAKAQRNHRVSMLNEEATNLDVHRQAWVRLADLSESEPLAQAVMTKIRDAHLYDSTPTTVVLSSLLVDVLGIAANYRKRVEELAASTLGPPPIFIVKDNKDDHSG